MWKIIPIPSSLILIWLLLSTPFSSPAEVETINASEIAMVIKNVNNINVKEIQVEQIVSIINEIVREYSERETKRFVIEKTIEISSSRFGIPPTISRPVSIYIVEKYMN